MYERTLTVISLVPLTSFVVAECEIWGAGMR
jgi:predicted small secreted protein